jgi:hypothetical protein
MITTANRTFGLFLLVFLINAGSLIVFFEIAGHNDFGIDCGNFQSCWTANFYSIYSYFLPVYFLQSLVYAWLFYSSNLRSGKASAQLMRWTLQFFSAFFLGLIIYWSVVYYRGYLFSMEDLFWSFLSYSYEMTVGKYSKIVLLIVTSTTIATQMHLRLSCFNQIGQRVQFNFDFLVTVFVISVLLFCNATVSHDMIHNDVADGKGFGFPYVWYIEDTTSGLIFLNKYIFDFLIYFTIVGLSFWLVLWLKSTNIFLIKNNRAFIFAITVLAVPGFFFNLLIMLRTVELNRYYYPERSTMRIHIGPLIPADIQRNLSRDKKWVNGNY